MGYQESQLRPPDIQGLSSMHRIPLLLDTGRIRNGPTSPVFSPRMDTNCRTMIQKDDSLRFDGSKMTRIAEPLNFVSAQMLRDVFAGALDLSQPSLSFTARLQGW